MPKDKPTVQLAAKVAGPLDASSVHFPVLGSVCVRGVRVFIQQGRFLSPSMEPYPNARMAERFSGFAKVLMADGLCCDAVLALPCSYEHRALHEVARDPEAPIDERAFLFLLDMLTLPEVAGDVPAAPFSVRWQRCTQAARKAWPANVTTVRQQLIREPRELRALCRAACAAECDRIVIRDPNAGYALHQTTVDEAIALELDPASLDGLM